MIARLSPRPLKRIQHGIFGQRRHIAKCPDLPRLDGKWAVITGANDGIGKQSARGLLQMMLHRLRSRHNTVQIGQIALNQGDFFAVKALINEMSARLFGLFNIAAHHEN